MSNKSRGRRPVRHRPQTPPMHHAPAYGVIVFPQERIPSDTIFNAIRSAAPNTLIIMVYSCTDYTESMIPIGFYKGLALRSMADGTVLVQVLNEEPNGLRVSSEGRTIVSTEDLQGVWSNVVRLQRVQPESEPVQREDDESERPADSESEGSSEPEVSDQDTGVEHQQRGEVLPSVGTDSPPLLEVSEPAG